MENGQNTVTQLNFWTILFLLWVKLGIPHGTQTAYDKYYPMDAKLPPNRHDMGHIMSS